MKALEEEGLGFNNRHYFKKTMGIEGGRAFVQSWLKMKRNRPTAVFSNGDMTAAGIISEVQKHGLRVPEDLAVLGFDNQPISELTTPAITTIAQPIEEMGQLATEILISSLEGQEVPEYRLLETKLILRDSV